MTNTINTFDERLSGLSLFAGLERFSKLVGKNKGVVLGGSGTMGAGIVNATTRAGVGTLRQDINLKTLAQSETSVHRIQAKAVSVNKLSPQIQKGINRSGLIGPPIVFQNREPFAEIAKAHSESREAAQRIVSDFLDANIPNRRVRADYGEATLLIEAGPEALKFKQNAAEFFELALSKGAILASNTSSLELNKIAERVEHPENIVGFHFFYPADRNPLVEIIATEKTSKEVIEAMRDLAYSMGKQPIVVWKDSPGAVANRILVGVLNEAAKIADQGVNPDLIDKVFMETFYEKQIGVKTSKAQSQFEAAPKLGFFKDEIEIYNKIKAIDSQVPAIQAKGPKGMKELMLLAPKKLGLLLEAQGKLNQKRLYASIVENHAALGSFFAPAKRVIEAREKAETQLKVLNEYLKQVEINQENLIVLFDIEPYELSKPISNAEVQGEVVFDNVAISNRLKAAYMAIAAQISNEDLASVHDIELACKQGFKWNVGPFELMNQMGIENAASLIKENLTEKPVGHETGISLPDGLMAEENLSGVKSYIQEGVGFIELGRLHIQNLVQMQNSLSPEMLIAIESSLDLLKEKGAKAIVFASQGGDVFSSGADLNYVQSIQNDDQKLKEFVDLGRRVITKIRNFELPTIAAINGATVGGGAELATACDYRIMVGTPDKREKDIGAYIAFPELGLGIYPAWGGTEYLPEIIGKEMTKALILPTTNPLKAPKLTARDAMDVGFAHAVVLQNELYPFLGKVLRGEVSEIDLSKKPQRPSDFDKQIPVHLQGKYKVSEPWVRPLTSWAAKEARLFIENSHNPSYVEERMKDERFGAKLAQSFRRADRWKVQPFVRAAQNKFFAKVFERFGLL